MKLNHQTIWFIISKYLDAVDSVVERGSPSGLLEREPLSGQVPVLLPEAGKDPPGLADLGLEALSCNGYNSVGL